MLDYVMPPRVMYLGSDFLDKTRICVPVIFVFETGSSTQNYIKVEKVKKGIGKATRSILPSSLLLWENGAQLCKQHYENLGLGNLEFEELGTIIS